MENRIVVIVPFYNVSKYIERCYQSLVNQQYGNYKLVFSDDCSTDGSLDQIPDNDNVLKIRREKRGYAIENIHKAIVESNLEDEDIVIIVDGDDFLLHDRVFYKINRAYEKRNCLLTYGQYCLNNGCIGICAPYTKEEFENLRSLNWRASHLKTFKYKVYDKFLKQDPGLSAYQNEMSSFYTMAYDVALMYPLMEISGYDNVHFIKDVLYVYRLHEMNDHHKRDFQVACEKSIQAKQPFQRMF